MKKAKILHIGFYALAFFSTVGFLAGFASRNQEEIKLSLPISKNSFSMASGYGERMHPVLKKMRMHTGIDMIADEGVSVVAAQEGVVVKAEMAHAWGNIIVIKHGETFSTSYSHLKSMDVKKGDNVSKGQLIGLVGHTGLSDKNHLHFELLKDGKAIDPVEYLPLD